MPRELLSYLRPDRPRLFADVAADPTLAESLAQPLQKVVEDLLGIARSVMEERRTLEQVRPEEERRVFAVMTRIAGTSANKNNMALASQRVTEMLGSLKHEFVLAQVKHQYGSDGSLHEHDVMAQVLTAFYPGFDFSGDEVVELDQHGPILEIRCWAATRRLILSAWLLGHAADDGKLERNVRIVRTFLESKLFRAPPGDIYSEKIGVRYDPRAGCVFAGFDSHSAKHVVVFNMMPRFVYVAERDEYYQVFLEFRPRKDAASWIRKCLSGRDVGDDIAFRLIVKTREEWLAIRSTLDQLMCGEEVGGNPHIVDGVRVDGSRNDHSVEDLGVLWKGVVNIPGVDSNAVELQVVLFSTYWDRVHSISKASDAVYKVAQWFRVIKGWSLAPIEVIYPSTLHPELGRWEYRAEMMRMRLLTKASNPARIDPEVLAYIEQVVEYFKKSRNFKLSD